MNWRIVRLYSFLILVSFSAQCLAVQQNHSDIVVGMSAAFRGPSKGLGIEMYRGATAYFNPLNARGGINGRKIRLMAYDDGYNPRPAVLNTIKLIEQDQALCLFGYVGTPTVTRVLPLLKRYQKQNILMFFPFTGAQPQREAPYDHFVYNLRASYRQETQGLVDHFVEVGIKKIAVLYQADAYGRSGWDGVKRALAAYHLVMIAEATYSRGTPFTSSMKDQVEILLEAQPEVVICIGAYAACAGFIRDARDSGFNGPIANLSFVGSENLLGLLVKLGEEKKRDYTRWLVNSQVVPSYEDIDLPAVREYRSWIGRSSLPKSRDLDYHPLRYSYTSFEGFLDAKLLSEIFKKWTLNLPKNLGRFDIGIDHMIVFENGHQGLHDVYYTTVENKKFVSFKDWKRFSP